MERHCSNALAIARHLQAHEKIASVHYPGLEGDKYYELAKKYMPKGTCGVISVEVKGGREAAVRFLDSLKLASIATHVADAKTCVLHPASHTHRAAHRRAAAGGRISAGLIRMSVGIENVDDLIADIDQALAQA